LFFRGMCKLMLFEIRERKQILPYRPIIYYRSWSLLFRRDFVNKPFSRVLKRHRARILHQNEKLPMPVKRTWTTATWTIMLLSLRATHRAFSSLKTIVNASVAIRAFENIALSVRGVSFCVVISIQIIKTCSSYVGRIALM